MYCPWDIIQYINELQTDHTCIPKNYWMNTSGNDIIQDLVQYSSDCIVDTFTSLLQGESIAVKSLETLSYPDIFRVKSDTPKDGTDEYIWHLLYCTGYLTTAKRDQAARDTQQQHLMIPNREIQGVCAHCVQQWFIQKTKTLDTNALFEAFWLSDAESVTTLLSDILLATISYYDYHESFYHAFVAGLFVSPDYAVQSNRESGLGRADLLIFDRRRKRSACIEIKVAESESDLAGRASIALQQIASMKYGEQHDPFLRNYPQKPLHWGFAFYKKDCLALCSR